MNWTAILCLCVTAELPAPTDAPPSHCPLLCSSCSSYASYVSYVSYASSSSSSSFVSLYFHHQTPDMSPNSPSLFTRIILTTAHSMPCPCVTRWDHIPVMTVWGQKSYQAGQWTQLPCSFNVHIADKSDSWAINQSNSLLSFNNIQSVQCTHKILNGFKVNRYKAALVNVRSINV